MRPLLGRSNPVEVSHTYVDNTMPYLCNHLPGSLEMRPVYEFSEESLDYQGTTNELASGIKAIMHNKDLLDGTNGLNNHSGGISTRNFTQAKQARFPHNTLSPSKVGTFVPTTFNYGSSTSELPASTSHGIGDFRIQLEATMMPMNHTQHSPGKRKKNQSKPQDSDNTKWLHCKMCECSVNSEYQMKIHNDGKKHQKKLDMIRRKQGYFQPSTDVWGQNYAKTVNYQSPASPPESLYYTWSCLQNGNSMGDSLVPQCHSFHPDHQVAYRQDLALSRIRHDSDGESFLYSSDSESQASI